MEITSTQYLPKLDIVQKQVKRENSNEVVLTPTKEYVDMKIRLKDTIGIFLNKKG